MGTMIMSVVTTLLEKKAAGHVLGLLVSKTQLGISAASVTGLVAVLPQAMSGDPTAIGQVVLIVLGWIGALYGRLMAKKA